MKRWLEVAPSIMRLAFGPTLIVPVEGREAGYRFLSPFLHAVQVDPGNTTDLVYQINRPRPTETNINGLIVNRLSRWAVVYIQNSLLSFDHSNRTTTNLAINESFLGSLTLDINTSKEFQAEIPKEQSANLLDELLNLAQEIASEGDIP